MKLIIAILLLSCSTMIIRAQSQLDVQGKPASTDTVAKINVNYSGYENVVGLSVKSLPAGPSEFWGIAGNFWGGNAGVYGRGNVTGIVGESHQIGIHGANLPDTGIVYVVFGDIGVLGTTHDGTGVMGISITDEGIYGESRDSAGIYGKSINGAGIFGTSTGGPGVHAKGGLALFAESDNIAISGISYGSVPITALIGDFGVVGSSADGPGLYGLSMLDDGVVGNANDVQNDFDFWAVHSRYGFGSSQRWKTNIENISNPLEKLSNIRGVSFDWDAEHGGFHALGFIAEEVGEVLPEIVTYEENGIDARGMDYTKISPLLVEAVKALRAEYQEKFKKQAEEMEALRMEILELRKKIIQ